MFTNNPLGHDYNEPMVDRLLGKAYQTIKEVHESLPDIAQAIAVGEDSKKVTASVDKLTATLKGFKEGTGLFIGHDLGEVGVEDSKDTYIGDNFLSELTKSGTNVKTVGDNVSTINRLAEHINELKAIAEALTSLLTVKDSLNEVNTINQNIEKIKTVANNSSNINSVYDCLDNINALAGSINDFPELIEHGEDIATVAKYLSFIVTVANNIVGFNDRITTNATNIANHEERISANETELADHEARITENTSDIESLGSRATALETLTAEHSETIEAHENRLRNIETTTDAGKWAEKLAELDATDARHDASIKALEDKNSAQDTALSEETQARIAKDTELESTISNTIDTTINNLPNKYVTLDTTQTISGTKVIKSSSGSAIFLQDTRFDRNTSPEQDIFNNIVFTDKNAKSIGYVQSREKADNTNAVYLGAARDKNGQSEFAFLGVVIPRDTTKVGYATAPQTPTLASNNEVATAKFVIDKITPIKANYVTTNTEQTITGKKTLSTKSKRLVTKIKITDVDSTVTPTENLWTDAIAAYDKNAKRMGTFSFIKTAEGNNQVGIQAINQNSNGHDVSSSIAVKVNNEGVVTTSAPTPSASSNDNNIATTSWVNDKVNPIKTNYVTTNTAQNITAIKTIVLPSNHHAIIVKDKSTANTDTPSSAVWQSMALAVDKNSKERGCVQSILRPDGSSCLKLMAIQQNAEGVNLYNTLELGIKADGTRISRIEVSPASNSNDTSIATTAWVKSKMLDFIYPVGSIYMSVNNVSPQTFLGGTWVALQDRFLIGAGHSYAVNATGGATTHTLTVNEMPSHSHTFAGSSIAAHNHGLFISGDGNAGLGDHVVEALRTWANLDNRYVTNTNGASGVSGSIAASGGNHAHSIMNPYLAVYMWKRTA